jgi:hypothetical protein
MIIPAIRTFLLAALLALPWTATARSNDSPNVPKKHNEATVAQLQAEMASGKLTSVALTKEYIARIAALDQDGPGVNAVIELNPEALDMARTADALRRHGVVLGPLHGIPVLVKDNVDTGGHDADHGRIVRAAGTAGASRLYSRREPSCGWRGDLRKDEPVRVGQLPLFRIDQWMVGPRRSN